MLAMIRTASKTTASLSEAKKRKMAPRCQSERGEEIAAMEPATIFARTAPGSSQSEHSRIAQSIGGSTDGAAENRSGSFNQLGEGQISDSFSAMISPFLPDQHQSHAFADFAVANRADRRRVHSRQRSCFSRSVRLAFSRLPFSASRISNAVGSVWCSVKPLLFSADPRHP